MSKYGRQGYMRTLEVMLAFILTFSFVVILLDDPITTKSERKDSVLEKLFTNNIFRNNIFSIVGTCDYETDTTIIANMTKELIEHYSFAICNNKKPTLPKKNVYVDSILITGNITHIINDPVIKLYYWN